MATIITTAIEKGGTGKTTTIVNLAVLIAEEGHRVLVVDMDQQANCTFLLTKHKKSEPFYRGKGLVNMFMNYDHLEPDAKSFIHPTEIENIDIIPSTAQTPRAIGQLAVLAEEYSRKEYSFLIDLLATVDDDYDYILIDTPPARDALTTSALYAAEHVLIPLRCDALSVEGFETTINMVSELERTEDITINILGIIFTQVENRASVTSISRDLFSMSEDYAEAPFNTAIRRSTVVSASTYAAAPVVIYDRKANPSKDYVQLWDEIKQRLNKWKEEHQ